jgi:hypothetical protein
VQKEALTHIYLQFTNKASSKASLFHININLYHLRSIEKFKIKDLFDMIFVRKKKKKKKEEEEEEEDVRGREKLTKGLKGEWLNGFIKKENLIEDFATYLGLCLKIKLFKYNKIKNHFLTKVSFLSFRKKCVFTK